jgi:hypothetical protein
MRKALWQIPLLAFALASCKEKPPPATGPGAGGAIGACIEAGAGVPAFTVKAVVGPDAGKSLCYV